MGLEDDAADPMFAPEPRVKLPAVLALVVAICTGIVATDFSLPIVAILAGTGLVCGVIRGTDLRSRALYTIPYLVGCFGVALSAMAYVDGRARLIKAEILVPIVVGGLPGVGVYLLIDKLVLPRLINGPKPPSPF